MAATARISQVVGEVVADLGSYTNTAEYPTSMRISQIVGEVIFHYYGHAYVEDVQIGSRASAAQVYAQGVQVGSVASATKCYLIGARVQ